MSQLPRLIHDGLAKLSAGAAGAAGAPGEISSGLTDLLEAERLLEDLSRGIEAFRESARAIGILDESRNGQRVYEAWLKLSRFYSEPISRWTETLCRDPAPEGEVPKGFEALCTRWGRALPELQSFVAEGRSLDQVLESSPVGTHVGYRIRSRILLLDRRAERAKVALDLLRRDIVAATKEGADRLTGLLGRGRGEAEGPRKPQKAPGGAGGSP